jgi:ATP-dependent protease Clp ATPase subunit
VHLFYKNIQKEKNSYLQLHSAYLVLRMINLLASFLKLYEVDVHQCCLYLDSEEVTVNFTDEAITRLAEIAYQVNQDTDNIGARRLHTILETLKSLFVEIDFNLSSTYCGVISTTAFGILGASNDKSSSIFSKIV